MKIILFLVAANIILTIYRIFKAYSYHKHLDKVNTRNIIAPIYGWLTNPPEAADEYNIFYTECTKAIYMFYSHQKLNEAFLVANLALSAKPTSKANSSNDMFSREKEAYCKVANSILSLCND